MERTQAKLKRRQKSHSRLVTVGLLLAEMYLEQEEYLGHCENCCDCCCHLDAASQPSAPPKQYGLYKIDEQQQLEEHIYQDPNMGNEDLIQLEESEARRDLEESQSEVDQEDPLEQNGKTNQDLEEPKPLDEETIENNGDWHESEKAHVKMERFWPKMVAACENVKSKMHGWRERMSSSVSSGDDVWTMQGPHRTPLISSLEKDSGLMTGSNGSIDMQRSERKSTVRVSSV